MARRGNCSTWAGCTASAGATRSRFATASPRPTSGSSLTPTRSPLGRYTPEVKRAISALELAVFCAICLGAGAFVVAARSRTNWDQDIWWHLRTGQWIAEHGQVPVTDPFSQYGQGKA